MIDETEIMLAPITGAAWFSFQLMFLEGFCFSFASFDVMFKDENTADMIKKCNDAAYDQIVKSYQPSNYNSMYRQTIDLAKTDAKLSELHSLEASLGLHLF